MHGDRPQRPLRNISINPFGLREDKQLQEVVGAAPSQHQAGSQGGTGLEFEPDDGV